MGTQVVFRCDLLPLSGLIGMHLLFTKRITFLQGLAMGLAACTLSLGLTVGVDSIFWRRILWPEGEVFWFNTIQNKCAASC